MTRASHVARQVTYVVKGSIMTLVQTQTAGGAGHTPTVDMEGTAPMHPDDTASAVPSQSPSPEINVPYPEPDDIHQGDVYAMYDRVKEPFNQGVGTIIHHLSSEFVNNGLFHGDTLLTIADSYSVCIEQLWQAARFLAERCVVELTVEETPANACDCVTCQSKRTWVQFSVDMSIDYELVKAERVRENERAIRAAREAVNRNRRPLGIVYLIRCGDRFKIGITTDMNRRLDQLKGQSPYPLELVHHATGFDHSEMESRLHRNFAMGRVHGEWFELDADQIAAVIEAINEWSQEGGGHGVGQD